jgi:hypothetical protein
MSDIMNKPASRLSAEQWLARVFADAAPRHFGPEERLAEEGEGGGSEGFREEGDAGSGGH